MALSDFASSLWKKEHVLFDKVINVQLLYRPPDKGINSAWKSFNIQCPPGGLKPNIFFHTELMPGGVATQFRLSIIGFNSEVDIALYSHMVITLSYRTSPMYREFTAAIFSAFIETPNPNGKTTFTGIIGDWFIDALREDSRNIIFKNPVVTIGELLWGIVEGKDANGRDESPAIKNGGLGLKLNVDLPRWVMDDKIVVGKGDQSVSTYWTESGYSCLNWLIDRISSYGDSLVARLRQQGVKEVEAEKLIQKARTVYDKRLASLKGYYSGKKVLIFNALGGNIAGFGENILIVTPSFAKIQKEEIIKEEESKKNKFED